MVLSGSAWAQSGATGLTLSQGYALALSRSENVRVAEGQLLAAQADSLAAWSAGAPQANLIGQQAFQNPETLVLPDGSSLLYQSNRQFQATASITQPLFRRGFFSNTAAAGLGEESAQALLTRTHQQLMIDVIGSFIGILRSRQQVTLAQSAVKRGEAQHANAMARFKAGGALRTAELQAAIALQRAQLQLVEAERAVSLESATFERLIGTPPPATLTLPPIPAAPTIEDAETAAQSRPDLRSLKLKADQARELVSVAAGRRLWPSLDLQAAYSYYAPASLGGPGGWAVTGTLTIPLFQGGAEYARIARQRAEAEIAEQQEALRSKQITEEVRQAFARLDAARKAASLAEMLEASAFENYNLVSNQFRLGGTTFLEVSNAQAALTEAENSRAVTSYDQQLAAFELLFATGELAL